MSKQVTISCQAAATIPFKKIKALQGELKSLSGEGFSKLKKSILKNGITSPIHVWKSKGDLYNLDGHQRCRVLGELEKQGFKIPPVPIVYVNAKNIKQAKEILLSNVSQYGRLDADGLYEFLQDMQVDLLNTDFELPGLNVEKFIAGYFDSESKDEDSIGAQEISSSRFETFQCKCPKCGFEFDSSRSK